MAVRLSSGVDIIKLFREVIEEWNKIYNQFTLYTISPEQLEKKS